MNKLLLLAVLTGVSSVAVAKLPPLSDEAKAKAAETAAKSAWTSKVDIFQLCKVQDVVASKYYKTATQAKPATPTPPCADPGPFVYTAATPAVPATATTAAVPATAATPSVPAASAAASTKTIEAAGAHSPTATAASPPSGKQTDAVVNPAKKP